MRVPKGSTRSRKYQVVVAPASESAGKIDFQVVRALDDEVLGQTSVTDSDVPVGAKVTEIRIRWEGVSLANVAVIGHWSLQRIDALQPTLDPAVAGGDPLFKNIMLSGMKSVGLNQNSSLNIRYKVPKKFWRLADGQRWFFVTNFNNVMTVSKEAIYKVFV